MVSPAESLPDAHVEPVSVGLFVKRRRTFVQLRTMTKWTALTIKLTREVCDPHPSRRGSDWVAGGFTPTTWPAPTTSTGHSSS